MVQESSEESGRSLLYTPTWAIAVASSVFILSSLIVERAVLFIGDAFKKRKQIALYEVLEKIKDELMLVGFISLALAFGQDHISKICVPTKYTEIMLQCKKPSTTATTKTSKLQLPPIKRKLAGGTIYTCEEGKAPFISVEALHDLHLLIFVLAVVHVLYSLITMALGMWKVHKWKTWEQRAKSKEELTAHDQRLARETSFVQRHVTGIWSTNPFLAYVAAFFQQFYSSVSETDYHTLRHGFIKSHMPGNVDFDFHKYMLRTLEEDFKHVIGIRPRFWGYAVLLMLVNIDGWEMHVWVSFIPLILVLIIGTKLQRIITEMAVQIIQRHTVVAGMPNVKLGDDLFWFKDPALVLKCIHFVLFQNSLDISVRIWSTFTFPGDDCSDEKRDILILRLIFGIFAQMICGYVTLPIYALVSQMGSSVKKTIFEEHIQLAIKRWHRQANARSDHGEHQSSSSTAAHHLEAQNDGVTITTSATYEDSDDDSHTHVQEGGATKVQRRMSYIEKV